MSKQFVGPTTSFCVAAYNTPAVAVMSIWRFFSFDHFALMYQIPVVPTTHLLSIPHYCRCYVFFAYSSATYSLQVPQATYPYTDSETRHSGHRHSSPTSCSQDSSCQEATTRSGTGRIQPCYRGSLGACPARLARCCSRASPRRGLRCWRWRRWSYR